MLDNLDGYPLKYFSVEKALAVDNTGAFQRMPYSLRVFAENILRKQSPEISLPLLHALALRRHDVAFPFFPSRVLLHDGTGIPDLVDLALVGDNITTDHLSPSGWRRYGPLLPAHVFVMKWYPACKAHLPGWNRKALLCPYSKQPKNTWNVGRN